MTAEHAPDFITSHPDRVVRSILYVCWIATFNNAEHPCGLPLAQSQVRCILFACNDGRNADKREAINGDAQWIVEYLAAFRFLGAESRYMPAVGRAESLARLRENSPNGSPRPEERT